jgi:hypothetical protein
MANRSNLFAPTLERTGRRLAILPFYSLYFDAHPPSVREDALAQSERSTHAIPANPGCFLLLGNRKGSSRVWKYLIFDGIWWAQQDSNLRLPPCEGGTLPLSYAPSFGNRHEYTLRSRSGQTSSRRIPLSPTQLPNSPPAQQTPPGSTIRPDTIICI